MSEDRLLALTMALGALTLVGASLLSRRLPVGRVMKLGLVWVAIFAAGYAAMLTFTS